MAKAHRESEFFGRWPEVECWDPTRVLRGEGNAVGGSPLLGRRGGCAIRKKSRSNLTGADGVVAQGLFYWSTTPPRTSMDASRIFLMCSAPLLARRGDRSPCIHV